MREEFWETIVEWMMKHEMATTIIMSLLASLLANAIF